MKYLMLIYGNQEKWASIPSGAPGRVEVVGRRASVSSIRASKPATSPSSGSSRCSQRVSRIASCGSVGTVSASPAVAVLPR